MPVKLDGGPETSAGLSKSKTAMGGGTHASSVSVKAGRSVVFTSPSGGLQKSEGLSKSKTAVGGGTHASSVSVKAGRSVVFPSASENLKNRRKPEEPGESAKEKPRKRKNLCAIAKQKLANPITQKFVFLTVMLLFLAAVILIHLYFQKLKSFKEKFRATTRIHEFMQRYNESFKGKKPLESIKGVEGILGELQQRQSRNQELQREIDDIISKLGSNWIPFGGYLYKFQGKALDFDKARKFCQDINMELPEIHSDEEQVFFLELINKHGRPCWIGIVKMNYEWVWIYSRLPAVKFYWSQRQPTWLLFPGPVCIEVLSCLIIQRPNCWNDIQCYEERHFFCRLKPNPKWL